MCVYLPNYYLSLLYFIKICLANQVSDIKHITIHIVYPNFRIYNSNKILPWSITQPVIDMETNADCISLEMQIDYPILTTFVLVRFL